MGLSINILTADKIGREYRASRSRKAACFLMQMGIETGRMHRLFFSVPYKLYFRNRQEMTPAAHSPNRMLCMEPKTSSAPRMP